MPKIQQKGTLSWISLGFALASIHYGLGFLVGSGESVLKEGPKGILYALSTGLGLFALALMTKFYRQRKYPIWDLLGNKYGDLVKKFVLFLSSFWMVGVVASQILGGAAALTIFDIPQIFSMLIITAGIYILSVLDIGRLSKVFFYMLLLSSALLLVVLFQFGFDWFPVAITEFVKTSHGISLVNLIEIGLTTILITVMGMDFHQFVVQAKDNFVAKVGCVFGGLILVFLSFVLLAIFLAGINMGINPENSREFVPLLLKSIGSMWGPVFGIMFCIPVILVSIGSGSAVTKIVARSMSEFINTKRKLDYRLITVVVAFLTALIGKSIVSLIVSFYAIYIAALLVPFGLYILEIKKIIKLPKDTIKYCLIFSTILSIMAFILCLIPNFIFEHNQTLMILISGIAGGVAVVTMRVLSVVRH